MLVCTYSPFAVARSSVHHQTPTRSAASGFPLAGRLAAWAHRHAHATSDMDLDAHTRHDRIQYTTVHAATPIRLVRPLRPLGPHHPPYASPLTPGWLAPTAQLGLLLSSSSADSALHLLSGWRGTPLCVGSRPLLHFFEPGRSRAAAAAAVLEHLDAHAACAGRSTRSTIEL